ncbi:MAG: N-acetylmuramoyl-L-alanine amidase [Scytonematopsis contorta HA4267-MV1]|nr:N-acetylmuramoyl-L-alanine amidase [Scytonematopsis contorta HA4267-MV1]
MFCGLVVKQLLLGLLLFGSVFISSQAVASEQSLTVVYPKTNHQTSADKIFFIGTAPPSGQVLINGRPINRSKAGHFAPSFPLQLGENIFTLRYQNQQIQIKVTRVSTQPETPQGLAFGKDSLIPSVDIARLPGELICFSAIAAPGATVSVKLGNQATVNLLPQPQQVQLPSNLGALTGRNQPTLTNFPKYSGCTTIGQMGSLMYGNNIISGAILPDITKDIDLGKPEFKLTLGGKTITQQAPGKINILSPNTLQVAEVTADSGVARTGPSTDHSRITPLPKGTQATVTGREGDWLRLDYGGWIQAKETRFLLNAIPPRTIIRSVGYRKLTNATQMVFPLQIPVPVTVKQGTNSFSLTLHNTTAQTDIIRLDDNPYISRLDWQQVAPGQVQYVFNLKKDQQWGYKLKYEGTSLVLTLRHPPVLSARKQKPLSGTKILLDPGHGGKESGAPGPNGNLEKDVNLTVSKLLREELIKRGATVVMTRVDDSELSLPARQQIIDKEEPTIALSVHYNSLPDDGQPEKTQGVGTFWYHSQAHSLAVFMHNYLVTKLGRPTYGVFWNNLALTRPESAPSVLLELGFMSNPQEFEWVENPQEQKKLAVALADGIVEWFKSQR